VLEWNSTREALPVYIADCGRQKSRSFAGHHTLAGRRRSGRLPGGHHVPGLLNLRQFRGGNGRRHRGGVTRHLPLITLVVVGMGAVAWPSPVREMACSPRRECLLFGLRRLWWGTRPLGQ